MNKARIFSEPTRSDSTIDAYVSLSKPANRLDFCNHNSHFLSAILNRFRCSSPEALNVGLSNFGDDVVADDSGLLPNPVDLKFYPDVLQNCQRLFRIPMEDVMWCRTGADRPQNDEQSMKNACQFVLRKRRTILFRLGAVCFPAVFLVLAEFGFRLAGSGSDYPLVNTHAGLSHLNPSVDAAYCREELRGPEPRQFQSERPDNEIRILVVGESSVWGYPFSSELSFPRQMECLLASQYPSKKVTVLNGGIVGLSSLPISDLVMQAAKVNPSMQILYCGHNEFYGAGGVSTNSPLSRLQIQLGRSRLLQFFASASETAHPTDTRESRPLISRMPKELAIPEGSPLIALAQRNYENNIARIARFCISHEIPLLLVSPVSNLRGQSPMPLPGQRERLQEIEREIDGTLTAENAATYLSSLKKLQEQNGNDATLHFRMAQCYELLNDGEKSRAHYILAREHDPCRYRASSQLSAILESVANSNPEQVEFLDVRDDFDKASRHGVPGDDLFLEHVHFTLDGHWLLAQLIAKAITDRLTPGQWDARRIPTLEERNEYLGMISEDELVGYYLAYYLTKSIPLNLSLDANKHQDLLQEKIAASRTALGEERAGRFDSLPHAVQMDDLIDGLGRDFLGSNDFTEAELYFRKSIKRRPWMTNGYLYAAVCRYKAGDLKNAHTLLQLSMGAAITPTVRVLNDQRTLQNILRESTKQ